MSCATRAAVGFGAALAAAGIGLAAFVASGVYNIGADDHHTPMVLSLIEHLRDRSVAVRARAIDVPDLEDAARIAAGARRYAALCSSCHLAPGVSHSDVRRGLYPHPPNLAAAAAPDARRAFWTIKHGIKMSAMPAWGSSLDDVAIWELVAFVRKAPGMSPDTYQLLSH